MNVKPPVDKAEAAQPPSLRSEIQERRAQVQNKTGKSVAEFDARSDVAPQPNGTLKSKKSLLIQAGKQVATDADATVDNAKDVVKGILNKDR